MKRNKNPMDNITKNPHIVEDFYIGKTRIQIADDFCVPKEEIPAILDNIAKKMYPYLWAEELKRRAAAGEE